MSGQTLGSGPGLAAVGPGPGHPSPSQRGSESPPQGAAPRAAAEPGARAARTAQEEAQHLWILGYLSPLSCEPLPDGSWAGPDGHKSTTLSESRRLTQGCTAGEGGQDWQAAHCPCGVSWQKMGSPGQGGEGRHYCQPLDSPLQQQTPSWKAPAAGGRPGW